MPTPHERQLSALDAVITAAQRASKATTAMKTAAATLAEEQEAEAEAKGRTGRKE